MYQSRMIINIRLAAHEIHRIILKMRSSLSAVCLNFFYEKNKYKMMFWPSFPPPYFIAQYLNVYSTWKWQKYFIWRQVNILYWFIRCLNRNLSMKTKSCKYYCATLTLPPTAYLILIVPQVGGITQKCSPFGQYWIFFCLIFCKQPYFDSIKGF